MTTKHQVHNLIILDESGSMSSIKGSIINGFNALLQTAKEMQLNFPEQEHIITFLSFNSGNFTFHKFNESVRSLEPLNKKNYNPNGSTPLLDAIGKGITRTNELLKNVENYNVLVTILTDGEENSSQQFRGDSIKILVEVLSTKRWTFTYVGTEHDVESIADSLSIKNTMRWEKDDESMNMMFAKERSSREAYFNNIKDNYNNSEDFYSK